VTSYRRAADLAVVCRDRRIYVGVLSGDVVVLQDNAALIWECVDGSTVDELIRTVADRVALSESDIAADTVRCLESMRQAQIVIAE